MELNKDTNAVGLELNVKPFRKWMKEHYERQSEDKSKKVDALGTELSNYKNNSTKSNDQIDDSIAALQVVKKDLDDCVDKLDTVVNNLDSYNTEGRKYLYTENK